MRERDLSGIGLSESEQLTDQPGQPFDLFQLTCHHAVIFQRQSRMRERQFDVAAHGSERRSQLVCHCRTELLHVAYRSFEAGDDAIEGVGYGIELVAGAAHWQPAVQVIDVDCRSRRGKACERCERPRRHPSSDDHDSHQTERNAPRDEAPEPTERGIALIEWDADLDEVRFAGCSGYQSIREPNLLPIGLDIEHARVVDELVDFRRRVVQAERLQRRRLSHERSSLCVEDLVVPRGFADERHLIRVAAIVGELRHAAIEAKVAMDASRHFAQLRRCVGIQLTRECVVVNEA